MTAVDAAYIPRVRRHFIVAGSKDCRITIWRFDPSKKNFDETKKKDSEILYGHHNEITALYIEKILGVMISSDKVYTQ